MWNWVNGGRSGNVSFVSIMMRPFIECAVSLSPCLIREIVPLLAGQGSLMQALRQLPGRMIKDKCSGSRDSAGTLPGGFQQNAATGPLDVGLLKYQGESAPVSPYFEALSLTVNRCGECLRQYLREHKDGLRWLHTYQAYHKPYQFSGNCVNINYAGIPYNPERCGGIWIMT